MESIQEHAVSPPVDNAHRGFAASITTAIVSGLAASACCVGPLLLAALGLGGAGLLVELEAYRPVFIVLTVGLLGVGFYFAYRKPKEAPAVEGDSCGCGEQPASKRVGKLGKVMLWVATAVAGLSIAFPYILTAVYA